MKEYKVVEVDLYNHEADGGDCDFNLSYNKRSGQEYVINHYASKGWKLIHALYYDSGVTVFLYFERDK